MKLKSIKVLITFLLFLLCAGITGNTGSLDSLIARYADAKMIKLNVHIVVTSDVFGDTDTTAGNITIADDGRYAAYIGNDFYIFDSKCIWEYSYDNNQATRDCLKPGETFENELVFIKNLKKYYRTTDEQKDTLFLLVKKDSVQNQLPDSLYLTLKNARLNELRFFDLNHDQNFVYILSDSVMNAIDPSAFNINLPDSAEVITLP
ncbi:MAG: hypothetical protein AB1746_01980 [Candidatus Zixiibacteriota bacterium]